MSTPEVPGLSCCAASRLSPVTLPRYASVFRIHTFGDPGGVRGTEPPLEELSRKMAELRKDPITGRWVIIATERKARPQDFTADVQPIRTSFCPFCEGNEDKTPPEIVARRPDGSSSEGDSQAFCWRSRA